MIYRIDHQHFLTHAIDHFPKDMLVNFQYAIISAKIRNGRRCLNVIKYNVLYPSPEIVLTHEEYKDQKVLNKAYEKMVEDEKLEKPIYQAFINPLTNHNDVLIICDECENDYITALCACLKKKYHIDVIDLNQLFMKGYVDEIYIDRDDIWDRAVDIRRQAARDKFNEYASTKEGQIYLIDRMTRKEMIEQLKKLEVPVDKSMKTNDLRNLLIDEWDTPDEKN